MTCEYWNYKNAKGMADWHNRLDEFGWQGDVEAFSCLILPFFLL